VLTASARYHPDGPDGVELDIDFTPPFRRIPLIKGLEEAAKIKIPLPLESDQCNQYLKDCCKRFNVDCGLPHTTTRLLDKLVGHFLEEQLVNPGFIIDHPQVCQVFRA
jgi:lysyl-tRNA synthetase class 2